MFDNDNDKGGDEEQEQEQEQPKLHQAAATATAQDADEADKEDGRREGSSEGDKGKAPPTTVEPPPAASVIDGGSSSSSGSASAAEGSCAILSTTAEAAVATTVLPPDASRASEPHGEGSETHPNPNNPAADKELPPTLVVPSPEAAADACNAAAGAAPVSGGVLPSGAAPGDAATAPAADAVGQVAASGEGASELIQKEHPDQAAAAAAEAFPLGNAVDRDGDMLMQDTVGEEAEASAHKSGDGETSPQEGDAMARGGVSAALTAAAASPAPATAAVEDGDERRAKVVKPDSVVEAAATTVASDEATATAAAAAAAASADAAEAEAEAAAATAVALCKAQREAAAAAVTRQKAKDDSKRAKRACEEACLRLFRTRGDIVTRTRGWSVERLLALRGGMLELGAALCGRGMPRAKVGSAEQAVDILIRYVDRRLP